MVKKTTKSQKKVYVFIDAENIRNSVASLNSGYVDLNYSDLYEFFTKKKNAVKIYVYVGIEQGDTVKDDKFNLLRTLGYSIYSKEVQAYKQQPYYSGIDCPKCTHHFVKRFDKPDKKKANCDADMTLDIVKHGCKGEYDEIIVFTGDGDFARVLEYVVNDLGKPVTLYSTMNKRTHTKLKNLGKDGTIKLEDVGAILSRYGEKLLAS